MSVRSFEVDRSKWATGRSGGLLANEDGKMCILGFFCQAAGVPVDKMLGKAYPMDVLSRKEYEDQNSELYKDLNILDVDDTDVSLSTINDDPALSHTHRERSIASIFSDMDINVNFVGNYD